MLGLLTRPTEHHTLTMFLYGTGPATGERRRVPVRGQPEPEHPGGGLAKVASGADGPYRRRKQLWDRL